MHHPIIRESKLVKYDSPVIDIYGIFNRKLSDVAVSVEPHVSGTSLDATKHSANDQHAIV